jgi:hypothetical protein
MAGGGGANAALPSTPVPVAAKAPATLKPKNTAPAAKSLTSDGYLKPSRTAIELNTMLRSLLI